MNNQGTQELDDFEAIFKTHYSGLVVYAFRILENYNEAEDVVQEVFFSYWKKRATVELTSTLKSYLYGAVKRQCQNKIRHAMVVHKYESGVSAEVKFGENPHDQLIGSEMEEVIKKTLDGLPDKTKKIFVMNRFESKKYKEIAKELSISLKTVEAHMGKVLKLLRLSLSHHLYMILLLIF